MRTRNIFDTTARTPSDSGAFRGIPGKPSMQNDGDSEKQLLQLEEATFQSGMCKTRILRTTRAARRASYAQKESHPRKNVFGYIVALLGGGKGEHVTLFGQAVLDDNSSAEACQKGRSFLEY